MGVGPPDGDRDQRWWAGDRRECDGKPGTGRVKAEMWREEIREIGRTRT
jgi:hypothetical protein